MASAPLLGFRPLADLNISHEIDQRTRVFTGAGEEFLPVPGLKRLERVRQNYREIPLTERREFPTDITHQRLFSLELTLVTLSHLADGTPILQRNDCCNDGLWQMGYDFQVTGEWDASVPPPEIPVPEKPKPVKGER